MSRKGERWYKNWQSEGFPRWLRERMEERGWNTVDLAERLGTRYTSGPTRWLTGQTLPSLASLTKLAEILELPVEEVYKAAGHATNGNHATADDPRLLHLLQRITNLDLTYERYMTLSAILTSMEEATPAERSEHIPPGQPPPLPG
jgi:transcriptional regulator with XRE-family HTH domain